LTSLELTAVQTDRKHRQTTGKKPVSLTIDAELLRAAREHGISLSATLERALQEELRKSRWEAWLSQNAAAMSAYNRQVAEHGVFSDRLRTF
jgi:antitoxin CcdA